MNVFVNGHSEVDEINVDASSVPSCFMLFINDLPRYT